MASFNNNKGLLYQTALEQGFRSGFEMGLVKHLQKNEVDFTYESDTIDWMDGETQRTYHPDFLIKTASGNNIFIEAKGRFVKKDRNKHLQIRAQHGTMYDIRFVFSNYKCKIDHNPLETYGVWCKNNDFLYADRLVPKKWLEE